MCWGRLVTAHFVCLGVFNCEHCTRVPPSAGFFFLREAAAAQIPAQLCNGPEIKQILAREWDKLCRCTSSHPLSITLPSVGKHCISHFARHKPMGSSFFFLNYTVITVIMRNIQVNLYTATNKQERIIFFILKYYLKYIYISNLPCR